MWNLGALPSEHRTQASHLPPKTQLLATQSHREGGQKCQVIRLWAFCPIPLQESLLRAQKYEKASPSTKGDWKGRTSFTSSFPNSDSLQPPLLCSALSTRPYTHDAGKEEMT